MKTAMHEHFALPYDFSKMEQRILANAAGCPIEDVTKIPREMRLGLLYGAGPRTIERWTHAAGDKTLRQINLEANIRMFENWQGNSTEKYLTQLRAENGSIAYAAVEAGIVTPSPVADAPEPGGTITGRHHPSWPEFQELDHIVEPFDSILRAFLLPVVPSNLSQLVDKYLAGPVHGAESGWFPANRSNKANKPKGSYPEDGILRD